jgi:hypothetical protein
VVKNAVAAARSDEDWVAASTIAVTPCRASDRPSRLITSTPVERDIVTTS